jgi:tripartite-type tricarboxylate transporter receptor subunit TctC
MMPRRAFTRSVLLALLSPRIGRAEPAAPGLRSLQFVVPTPPGSQPDLIARWLTEPMSRLAATPAMVLNRPGAAGAIAADTVLAAPVESGSLLLSGLDAVAYSHLNSNRRRLDPFVDFVPVGAASRDTWLLVVPAGSRYRSVAEIVDAPKDAPLNFASSGEGSTPHLVAARFARDLGIRAVHVPYKQSYLPDLIAGRIDFVVAPTPAMVALVRSGQLRALCSLTDARLAVLEDVPTIRELGRADQVFYGGLFVFAPAGLSARAAQINDWLLASVRDPAIKARFHQAGIETVEHDLEQVRHAIADRLRTVDAMREAVFGRT